MNAEQLAAHWLELAPNVTEISGYQEHFRDLCSLVGAPTPSSDVTGQDYRFEMSVKRTGKEGKGRADVFKRGSFVFEYKALGRDLEKAFAQMVGYQHELGNPPLLVATDFVRFEINTNFTGTNRKTYKFTIEDLASGQKLDYGLNALELLQAVFHDPNRLDPRFLREKITQEATARIGTVAQALKSRGLEGREVGHFLMRVVFCLFAEDAGLLERGVFERLLTTAQRRPEQSKALFAQLFAAMSTGGFFGSTEIMHFNGGLFDSDDALPLEAAELDALVRAAKLDWAEVEPSIFGTLFEESLETTTRSARGAHYTNVTDILRVVEPVVVRPLRAEFEAVIEQANAAFQVKRGGREKAQGIIKAFHERLAGVRVLDPACGSGNFLYVTLKQLLDLENELRAVGETYGLGAFALPPRVHPRQMLGIEVESFAHELAGVVLWIGHIQWKRAHGGEYDEPVLQKLHNIVRHDALLNDDGTEYQWPQAEFIVGNPPFLGDKKMRSELRGEYVDRLRAVYADRIPGQADFVTYAV